MSTLSDVCDAEYTLDHRYTRREGRIFLTGMQALVRLPLMQRWRDEREGLHTAGFISGYRGSPLGTYDLALVQAARHLEAHGVRFEPGVNEDLAATAVWGSQLAPDFPGARYDGVFGIWYGKGPGVDRSCDALKHGNYQGTARLGGVLVLAGDDPSAESSSIAHESEPALVHMGMPILNPATIQDYLDFGLLAFAMSRYSGCWVGFKCVTDTVESAASVQVGEEREHIVLPGEFSIPDDRRRGPPVGSEEALYHVRLPAVQAFARANALDRTVLSVPTPRLGIVTTGKAYLDVRQALEALGLDAKGCADLGLDLYKVALTWPLEPEGALAFCADLEHVLVVEEKRPLVEDQLRTLLYARTRRPSIEGKRDTRGERLVPDTGALAPAAVRQALRRWLEAVAPGSKARLPPETATEAPPSGAQVSLTRHPSFCAGCPHNRSTHVPEGSVAGGGIGCHGMAAWMPSRQIALFSHMGGEGANWVGIAPFTETSHIFQNLGDGTFFHSGLLAIRANVVAGTRITYKILNNGAVAMTGGQRIEGESLEGEITTPEIAQQLVAEGVVRIAVLSNEPEKYRPGSLPGSVTVHGRNELDRVQRELRDVPGVSALIYDQTCAAEARRLRRQGAFPEPNRRIVIHEGVCEGCGDCGVQSNCVAIEPVETAFGRKRRVSQSVCNKDFSCLDGHCPSFVSVIGGQPRKLLSRENRAEALLQKTLPEPPRADATEPIDILVTGIGGTGVVTLGAILGMAAHLEGRACTVLDVTGLSQKNGAVTSHVRIADRSERLHATRIARGGADLVLGCDPVVTAAPDNLEKIQAAHTEVVVNRLVTPTAEFAGDPDLDLSAGGLFEAMEDAVGGSQRLAVLDATKLATALLGDALFANPFLLGYALEQGFLPVGLSALERAIALNGRNVEENNQALRFGRLAAIDLDAVERAAGIDRSRIDSESAREPLEALVETRARFLEAYQDKAYARRYRRFVARVAEAAKNVSADESLPEAVARNYFKLLAYKDEYEVARLLSESGFRAQLREEFEGDFRLVWHAAPPRIPFLDRFLDRRDPETGRTRKIALGAWVFPLLGLLARFRFLRGSFADPFRSSSHRRLERRLIGEYEEGIEALFEGLSPSNYDLAVSIAGLPEGIRGFEAIKEESVLRVRKHEVLLREAFLRVPRQDDTGAKPQERED